MKRMQLLAMIAALMVVLCAAVVPGSPFAPVVEPAKDIEEIWAIEDARSESDVPLVTALENHGVPLAYDAQSNTFYCTLGLDNEEEWPQLHLQAPPASALAILA